MNQNTQLGPLPVSPADTLLTPLLPAPPRGVRTTIISTAGGDREKVVGRVIEAGLEPEQERFLGQLRPTGAETDPKDDLGVRLGTMAALQEAMIASLDSPLRMSPNTNFPYLTERKDKRKSIIDVRPVEYQAI